MLEREPLIRISGKNLVSSLWISLSCFILNKTKFILSNPGHSWTLWASFDWKRLLLTARAKWSQQLALPDENREMFVRRTPSSEVSYIKEFVWDVGPDFTLLSAMKWPHSSGSEATWLLSAFWLFCCWCFWFWFFLFVCLLAYIHHV